LYSRSNLVVFSSEYLKNQLNKRYYSKDNSLVINNAVELNFDEKNISLPESLSSLFKQDMKNICYIGTVSDWFDFNLILKSLDMFKNINFILIGPSDTDIPVHERLVRHPQIPHAKVLGAMKKADLLVMPFKVDELVRSVNPVKAYEYIYSCTPSILVRYEETEKFKDYLYLYNNEQEFFEYINKLIEGKLPLLITEEGADAFANKNTWEKRTDILKGYLNKQINS